MNAARYGEWAENAVFNATVFLDCVCSEFLQRAKKIRGLEKTVRYTEKARSVGLGMLGFHTLLQMRNYPLDSIDTVYLNSELFQELNTESLRASQWLAAELGEPEFCKGYGVRNLNRCAIAPNTSSAVIAGSVSPGIEPIFANAFLQPIAGGEVNRVNPVLIEVMKEQGRYNTKAINRILLNEGSVQDEDWLTDHQKRVFLTAFEVDQLTIIRLASQRQKSLDQGQSLNLFFAAGTAEEYISKVHQAAFLDDEILGLYYIRSNSSNKASTGEVACESCAS
jgi:ribonucleoside-diphosphate reductase alpha chain